nr:HAMP domain-containing sensor histidine kinase [Parabacteroides goldsteinii]
MKTKSLFMDRGIKLVCIVVLLLCTISAFSQNERGRLRTDSLQSVLQKTKTPEEKLTVLKELVAINRQQKVEVSLGKEIMNIAMQSDSFQTVYNTMAELSRYYYNQDMRDSMLYWYAMIDTISRQRRECPDALFTAGSLICQDYLWGEDYELSMSEAIRQINLADKEHQEYGQASGNYNLALIYQVIGQDSNAVVAFRKGLVWLDKNLDRPMLELQFLSDMVVSTLRLNLLDESEKLLIRYENLLDRMEQDYETKGYLFPVFFHKCLLNTKYSEFYTRSNQLGKAHDYLEKASAFISDTLSGFVKYAYYQSEALYYMKVKNNQKALSAIDNALALENDLDMMNLKMKVLRQNGQLQEAILVYKKMLKMNASINNDAFNRQITQLRALNDLNDSEKQNRELKHQNEQIASKQRQLFHILVTISILLILVLILYRLYCRTHRLKNELLREKDSLLESEKQLRIIKEKAVEANRLKTVFLANISHEIRTPLNAIVGFSELLVDNSFQEKEKVVFASTINHSSELLMNLINDVLELSRLESGNNSFTIREWDAVVLCREILSEVETKLLPGVKLIFNHSVESLPLNTDRFRLRQLLKHLLSNAVKFTRKGEVNLTIETDRENDLIRFIVTDTGCGIPADMGMKIFERFEKLDEFKQGTGLGLAICQLVATRFGGSLYLDPSYTEGARFVFVHPCNVPLSKEVIS